MDAAARATQLSDWGDGPFQEGLDAFCRGINEDEKIHHMGRLLTKRGIEKWLTDRLEIQQLVSSEPGITQRPVEVPVVIPGFPRSGTTFLHRLMAVDPQFRTTQAWETYFPVPPPDPRTYHEDPRIQMTEKLYEMTFRTCPALATTHPMDATWGGGMLASRRPHVHQAIALHLLRLPLLPAVGPRSDPRGDGRGVPLS